MCSRPSYFSFFPLCWGRTLSAKISSSHLASILPAQGATLLLLHHVFPWDSPWDSPLENDNVSTGGCKNCRWIFIASGEFSLTFSLYFLLFLAGFKGKICIWHIKKILCNIRLHNCRVFKLGKAACHLLQ